MPLNSNFYTDSKIVYNRKERIHERVTDPNGFLFSKGIYPTKIRKEELPPWYLYGYFGHRNGWLNTKGVVDLYYRPNKHFNHLFRDDFLFISYHGKITPSDSLTLVSGYDECIWGGNIVPFLIRTKDYSGYDIEPIKAQIRDKLQWFKETFPDDYSAQVGDWVLNFVAEGTDDDKV